MEIYIDATETLGCGALTGIQRVTIEYLRALRENDQAVCAIKTRGSRQWKLTEEEIKEMLARGGGRPAQNRKIKRLFWGGKDIGQTEAKNLLLLKMIPETAREKRVLFAPEVFSKDLPEHLNNYDYTVALVHDLSTLNHPEWSSAKSVEEFPKYLKQISFFDMAVTPSRAVADDLERYFNFIKLVRRPVIRVVEHGSYIRDFKSTLARPENKVFLSVGTIELRKNHLSLLKACEQLWNEGENFSLNIVGIAVDSGKEAVKEIRRLQKKQRPIIWRGALSEEEMNKAWEGAWAFVYPSFEEGFGLPIIESLARGVPVVCGAGGALVERAKDGGCELLRAVDVNCLYFGIKSILNEKRRAELAAEAREIKPRKWSEAAEELVREMETIIQNRPTAKAL